DFCGHLSALRRSPNTIRGYRADLIDLMGHAHSHGDDTLGRIGTSQVRAWLADTRVAGASAATMQRRWSAARVFFRWAANEGLISADPTTALNSAKVPKRLPATL
ncbi:site-specific integrase, partial [Xanthomonas citri pv. citri]|nr:site-specific integrase [Xanthomonas citri pv. citri]